MSASLFICWPESTEADRRGQPGFFNDNCAWVAFLSNILSTDEEATAARATLESLDLEALLACIAIGTSKIDSVWTTPDELERAIGKSLALLDAGDKVFAPVLAIYELDSSDAAAEEMAADLADLRRHASWAKQRGARRIAMEYSA